MAIIVDLQIAYKGDFPTAQQFQKWSETAYKLGKESLKTTISADAELSIRLVDSDESATLNKQYRGKDGATNVLSFPFEAPIVMEPDLLGDLVVCVPLMTEEAQQQNKALNDHWAHLVVHGCLHLLGYDHIDDAEAELMEALEVKILQELDIADPYQEQEK